MENHGEKDEESYLTYAGEQRLGRRLGGRRCGSGRQFAAGGVRLLAGPAAHLCRAVAILLFGRSVALVVVVVFAGVLGRSHGRRVVAWWFGGRVE
jgi:hypothetical protein